jgi:hypothetical protein
MESRYFCCVGCHGLVPWRLTVVSKMSRGDSRSSGISPNVATNVSLHGTSPMVSTQLGQQPVPTPLVGMERGFVTRTSTPPLFASPPRLPGWNGVRAGAGCEPPLHPDQRGGGERARRALLVTNRGSTPASGVGASPGNLCRYQRDQPVASEERAVGSRK